MKIIIAECAIERAPDSWLDYQEIREYYAKRKRMPLKNASNHQHLLQDTPITMRNDRPDILHFGLLTILGFTKVSKDVKVYFSSKDGFFHVESKTKLPRSQTRFNGLIETVFAGSYKGGLITKENSKTVLSDQPKILFSKYGTPISEINLEEFSTFIFGGFSSGSFREKYENAVEVSLNPNSLDLWTAILLFYQQHPSLIISH